MKTTLVSLISFQFLLLTNCIAQYHYGTPPGYNLRADGGTRINGIQDLEDKDITLGGLLRVHSNDPPLK